MKTAANYKPWMKKGVTVRAHGKLGIITGIESGFLLGRVDYIFGLKIKLSGEKQSVSYHPVFVEEAQ